MAESRIVELGDTEPYDGLWRLIRFGRDPWLAVALGTVIGVAAIGALLMLERERDEARLAAAPCAAAGRPANEVVRTFFERIDRGDPIALGSCWSDADDAGVWVDRLARTGGPSQLAIATERFATDAAGRRIAQVLATPTWRIDADVLWPSGSAKSFVLRDDGDGRWRLVGIYTPIWDVGPCADSSLGPVDVVRTFFAYLAERQVVGMEACWIDRPDDRDRSLIVSRYLATGGATSVSVTANRAVPDGHAVRVTAQWRASPWSGDCCQRWFVLRSQGGHWRIGSVETSPP